MAQQDTTARGHHQFLICSKKCVLFKLRASLSSVDCGTILRWWSTIKQSSLEVAENCVQKHLDKWRFLKSHSTRCTKYFSIIHLAVFGPFTFAVVEELFCEDRDVKDSSVLPFCILLLITRDSEREGDKLNCETIWQHRLTARGGHSSSRTAGGWVIDFISGHKGNTELEFKK